MNTITTENKQIENRTKVLNSIEVDLKSILVREFEQELSNDINAWF